MTKLFTSLFKIGIIVGLTIFIYSAWKYGMPDRLSTKILMWSLLSFGVFTAITHWND